MLLTGQNIFAMLLINIILDIVVLYQVLVLASKCGADSRSLVFIAIVQAVYINHIAYTNLFSSEIPFLLFFILYLHRIRIPILPANNKSMLADADTHTHTHTHTHEFREIFTGILFSCAVLIKPIVLFFPLFIALAFRTKESVKHILLHYSVLFLFLLPLTYRNYTVTGEFVFISLNGPVNLFIGNNPYANGTYLYNDTLLALLGNPKTELEESKAAGEYAVKYIIEHPLHALSRIPYKVYYQYISDVEGVSSNIAGLYDTGVRKNTLSAIRWAAQLFYLGIILLLIAATYRYFITRAWRRGSNRISIPVLWYYFMIYLPFFGASRFHYTVMPFVFIFIAENLISHEAK